MFRRSALASNGKPGASRRHRRMFRAQKSPAWLTWSFGETATQLASSGPGWTRGKKLAHDRERRHACGSACSPRPGQGEHRKVTSLVHFVGLMLDESSKRVERGRSQLAAARAHPLNCGRLRSPGTKWKSLGPVRRSVRSPALPQQISSRFSRVPNHAAPPRL